MRWKATTGVVAAASFVGALMMAPTTAYAEEQGDAAANKQYYETWIDIDSYKYDAGPDGRPHMQRTGGVLYAGTNYFYCQQQFDDSHHDDHGNSNNWWARTDDDSGNTGVWVPATAFTVGGDYEPIPGLESC